MEWTPARIRRLREAGLCLSQDGFAAMLGVAKRTVGNAERGAHPPSLALRCALDQALEKASDAQRDRFLATTAAPAIHETSPTLDSVELLRRTEASDLGTGTLEQLAELVEQLGMEYFAVPPAEFRETVLSWRRYVARLLDGRLTLRERRCLYAVAGWLSGLVAAASLALGDHAEPHCTTALSLAQEVGDARLAGWIRGTQAQIAGLARLCVPACGRVRPSNCATRTQSPGRSPGPAPGSTSQSRCPKQGNMMVPQP